jgi:hypothetical protein
VVRGRTPTLTSVVARRPVAVSSIDAAASGFALIRRARLPPLCPQSGHTSCRFPLLRCTHCFSGLGPLIDLVPVNLAAKPALASGDCRPRFSEGSGPDGDPPIRSTLERPVVVAGPIDATSVLNGTDDYLLQCYFSPKENWALWNEMMAPSPPPRSTDEDYPRPDHTQEEAV